MNPYLEAHRAYHAGPPPTVSWTLALEYHFQFGYIVSTPELFLLCRLLPLEATDLEHLTLTPEPFTGTAGDLHVWIAAGPLGDMLAHVPLLPFTPRLATFQRTTGRLHRVPFHRLK